MEIGIPDIVSKVKMRQLKFFCRMCNLRSDETSLHKILRMCADLPCLQYYHNIDPDIVKTNLSSRQQNILTSDNTYYARYTSLVGVECCHSLYKDVSNELMRIVITRWRLSNHKLRIETGRYTRPVTPREERICILCRVVEDEEHVIFHCPIYRSIRLKYADTLSRYDSVKKSLNPVS